MSEVEDKNFCVYVHADTEGNIRYIGSGTMYRAHTTYANSHRGKKYAEFVNNNGRLKVEIISEGLTKVEAEDLERKLYDKYEETILNYRRPVSENTMTKEMFNDHLYYDESSPSCIRWKTNRVGGNGAIIIEANSEAGYLNKSCGYYKVGLQGKLYQAHRVVCVLHGIKVHGRVIDHIDRDRSNNKISNLRVVSQKENMKNLSQSKINSRNKSGFQGVKYNKQGYWVVTWNENCKRNHKYFPIKNYQSSEEAFAAAVEYRKQMVDLYYN